MWSTSMVPPSFLLAARTSLPVSCEAVRFDATATAPAVALTILVAGKFRVGNERIEPKTIFGTPKRGVRRFKWVPHDLNHLGLGGAENRLGLQKRGLEVEMLKLQYLGRG